MLNRLSHPGTLGLSIFNNKKNWPWKPCLSHLGLVGGEARWLPTALSCAPQTKGPESDGPFLPTPEPRGIGHIAWESLLGMASLGLEPNKDP